MTSKLTILSIDPETAGEDVRRMQEALCLLEQLRQLLKNIGSHDLADLAVCAAQELQEAVRCIREAAQKYENVELEPELTRPGEGSGAVWLAAAAAAPTPMTTRTSHRRTESFTCAQHPRCCPPTGRLPP